VETLKRKESLTVLRRLISYGEKNLLALRDAAGAPGRSRLEPRRSTPAVVKAALVMFLDTPAQPQRFGPNLRPRFWKQMAAEPLASADTLGRVPAGLYADQLRQTILPVLSTTETQQGSARSSGHRPRRCWMAPKATPVTASLCRLLQRTIHSEHGDRLQHYHRQAP